MKKSILSVTILAVSAFLFASCQKSSTDTPTPSPTPSYDKTATIRIDAERSDDLLKIIDFSGSEFRIGNEVIDLSGLSTDKTFTIKETTSGSLKIIAKPKAGFSFDDNTKYDVIGLIEVSLRERTCCIRELGLKGFSYAKEKERTNPRTQEQIIERWCNKLTANYSFTVNPDGTISDSGR